MKPGLVCALPLVLLLAAPGCYGRADVNQDTFVDDLDLAMVEACLGLDPSTPGCERTDVDGDGDVDVHDRNFVFVRRMGVECNGASALCDHRYDQVAYATSHNAFAALDDGFHAWAANQQHSMRQQLLDGMRGLMLDTYFFQGDTWLCHGSCEMEVGGGTFNPGRIPLVEGLTWIVEFLDAHPAEVVSIIFESYLSEALTEQAFAASGLLEYLHAQPAGEPWPTLRRMIRSGRRVVVFTDDSGASLPWHHYVWQHAFETDWNYNVADAPVDELVARLLSPEGCEDNRGTPPADLFILNHFLTATAGHPDLADLVNHDPELTDRAELCWQIQGRIPNFVTVDYHQIGDVQAAVASLNGI